jgi:hypothetical protein
MSELPEKELSEKEYSIWKKLQSRRFTMAMLVIIVSSLMLFKGLIQPANYETLMIWISGIYIIGKPFGDMIGEILAKK